MKCTYQSCKQQYEIWGFVAWNFFFNSLTDHRKMLLKPSISCKEILWNSSVSSGEKSRNFSVIRREKIINFANLLQKETVKFISQLREKNLNFHEWMSDFVLKKLSNVKLLIHWSFSMFHVVHRIDSPTWSSFQKAKFSGKLWS